MSSWIHVAATCKEWSVWLHDYVYQGLKASDPVLYKLLASVKFCVPKQWIADPPLIPHIGDCEISTRTVFVYSNWNEYSNWGPHSQPKAMILQRQVNGIARSSRTVAIPETDFMAPKLFEETMFLRGCTQNARRGFKVTSLDVHQPPLFIDGGYINTIVDGNPIEIWQWHYQDAKIFAVLDDGTYGERGPTLCMIPTSDGNSIKHEITAARGNPSLKVDPTLSEVNPTIINVGPHKFYVNTADWGIIVVEFDDKTITSYAVSLGGHFIDRLVGPVVGNMIIVDHGLLLVEELGSSDIHVFATNDPTTPLYQFDLRQNCSASFLVEAVMMKSVGSIVATCYAGHTESDKWSDPVDISAVHLWHISPNGATMFTSIPHNFVCTELHFSEWCIYLKGDETSVAYGIF